MRKQIRLDFERGGTFMANLFWEEAPETCKALWERLPLTLEVMHAKFSGHVIGIFPGISLKVVENSRCIGVMPGEIVYNPHMTNSPSHPHEIGMVYGPAVLQDSFGYAPCNLIAKIKEDQIPEFIEIGKRIDTKGRETVAIVRHEPK